MAAAVEWVSPAPTHCQPYREVESRILRLRLRSSTEAIGPQWPLWRFGKGTRLRTFSAPRAASGNIGVKSPGCLMRAASRQRTTNSRSSFSRCERSATEPRCRRSMLSESRYSRARYFTKGLNCFSSATLPGRPRLSLPSKSATARPAAALNSLSALSISTMRTREPSQRYPPSTRRAKRSDPWNAFRSWRLA